MRILFLIPALLASSALAQNTIPPPSQSAQGAVSVTIYNNELALVQDTRQLDIPQGRSRQEFPDVSAQIRPETVTLSTPPATSSARRRARAATASPPRRATH